MKKLILLACLAFATVSFSFAGVNKYYVDDQGVETLFNQSQEIATPDAPLTLDMNVNNATIGEKNEWAAFVISWALGYLGIHRLYLGTETMVFIGYLCTGGLFGINYTIDTIMLLIGAINGDIGKYVDNPKFFMWM